MDSSRQTVKKRRTAAYIIGGVLVAVLILLLCLTRCAKSGLVTTKVQMAADGTEKDAIVTAYEDRDRAASAIRKKLDEGESALPVLDMAPSLPLFPRGATVDDLAIAKLYDISLEDGSEVSGAITFTIDATDLPDPCAVFHYHGETWTLASSKRSGDQLTISVDNGLSPFAIVALTGEASARLSSGSDYTPSAESLGAPVLIDTSSSGLYWKLVVTPYAKREQASKTIRGNLELGREKLDTVDFTPYLSSFAKGTTADDILISHLFDVSPEDGQDASGVVTFTLDAADIADPCVVLHFHNGAWEPAESKRTGELLSVTVQDGLSPFAIAVRRADAVPAALQTTPQAAAAPASVSSFPWAKVIFIASVLVLTVIAAILLIRRKPERRKVRQK